MVGLIRGVCAFDYFRVYRRECNSISAGRSKIQEVFMNIIKKFAFLLITVFVSYGSEEALMQPEVVNKYFSGETLGKDGLVTDKDDTQPSDVMNSLVEDANLSKALSPITKNPDIFIALATGLGLKYFPCPTFTLELCLSYFCLKYSPFFTGIYAATLIAPCLLSNILNHPTNPISAATYGFAIGTALEWIITRYPQTKEWIPKWKIFDWWLCQ